MGWTDLERAVSDSEAEAWIVACTTAAHVPVMRTLLQAGKAVLLEKPISSSLDEARSLRPLVRADSSNLMIGHIVLFNSEYQQLREEVRRGGPIPKIHDKGPFHTDLDKSAGQADPLSAAIQDSGIGRRDDRTRCNQLGVGVRNDLSRPVRFDGADHCSQPTAVRDRCVEQPRARSDSPLPQPLRRQVERGACLLDTAIGPVHARHVTIAAIATRKDDPTAQSRLQRQNQVERVDPKGPSSDRPGIEFARSSSSQGVIRTGRTEDGDSLSLHQPVSVPDQAQGRRLGIAARKQPGQVGNRGAKASMSFSAEPSWVLGAGASVLAGVRHAVIPEETNTFREGKRRFTPLRRIEDTMGRRILQGQPVK